MPALSNFKHLNAGGKKLNHLVDVLSSGKAFDKLLISNEFFCKEVIGMLARWLCASALGLLLSACGGGSDGPSPSTGGSAAPVEGGAPNGSDNPPSSGGDSGGGGGAGSGGSGEETPSPGNESFVYDETARFNEPSGITSDADGNLFVLDRENKTIRKIATAGNVTTIPIALNSPVGLEIDNAGDLYTYDSDTLLKISQTGDVTRLATVPGDIHAIEIDADGNAYLLKRRYASDIGMDTPTGEIIRVTRDGTVTTIVTGPTKNEEQGELLGKPVLNDQSRGLTRDAAGNLYVGTNSSRVLRISPDGTQEPYAFIGSALPTSMAFDPDGNLYIGKFWISNYIGSHPCKGESLTDVGILRVTPDGMSSRFFGVPSGGNPSCPSVSFGFPYLTPGQDGNLYVAYSKDHAVYRVSPEGEATLIAGKSGEAGSSD